MHPLLLRKRFSTHTPAPFGRPPQSCFCVLAITVLGAAWLTSSAVARTEWPSATAISRAASDPRLDPRVGRMLLQRASATVTPDAKAGAASSNDKLSLLLRADIRSSD